MKVLLMGISVRAFSQSIWKKYTPIAVDAFGDLDTRKYAKVRHLRKFIYDMKELHRRIRDMAIREEYDIAVYGGKFDEFPEMLSGFEVAGNSAETVTKLRDGKVEKVVGRYLKVPRHIQNPVIKCGAITKVADVAIERVHGKDISYTFISDGNDWREIGFAKTESIIVRGAIFYRASIAPFNIEDEKRKKVESAVDKIVDIFGLKGINCIDMIDTEKDIYFLELNPRPSASLELFEKVCERSLLDMHIKGKIGTIKFKTNKKFGKYIVYSKNSCKIKNTRKLLKFNWIADIPYEGRNIKKGEPLFTVFATGNTYRYVKYKMLERAREAQRLLSM